MAIYLNSYRPLCYNGRGRKAIQTYGLPPFVDHSTRREPELESPYPGISSICRGSKFAPRLKIGDMVVYITVKRPYQRIRPAHWRLVTILEVIEQCLNHAEAAEWYRSKGLQVPTNCVVEGSNPLPLDRTALTRSSEAIYQERARLYPQYLICRARCIRLTDPPMITTDMWQEILGRIPATQNPTVIGFDALAKLESLCMAQS